MKEATTKKISMAIVIILAIISCFRHFFGVKFFIR